jgi:hypothetical protein
VAGFPQISPLKIGILGAARIADDGIVEPSQLLGHRLVAVAARDKSRAEAFAAQRGVEKVHQTYAEVIEQVNIELTIPAPPDSDPRWSLELAGGGRWISAAMCSTLPGRSVAG